MSISSVSVCDAVDWLRSLDQESVDLVITDPPYESLEKHRKRGTTTRLKMSSASSNKWFDIFPNDRFEELFRAVYRVLKPNSHFYLQCDQETMFVAKPIGEAVGFRFWKPLVWDKVSIGLGYHYRARYEFILFFEKGKRKLSNLSTPDVLVYKRIRSKGAFPTEKPVDLYRALIEQSSIQGELVADPFLGSGNCGVAAVQLGRDFAGCDISEDAVENAYSRISECGFSAIMNADFPPS